MSTGLLVQVHCVLPWIMHLSLRISCGGSNQMGARTRRGRTEEQCRRLPAIANPTQYRTHGVVRTNRGDTRGNVVEQVRAVPSLPPAWLWLVRRKRSGICRPLSSFLGYSNPTRTHRFPRYRWQLHAAPFRFRGRVASLRAPRATPPAEAGREWRSAVARSGIARLCGSADASAAAPPPPRVQTIRSRGRAGSRGPPPPPPGAWRRWSAAPAWAPSSMNSSNQTLRHSRRRCGNR